MLVAASVLAMLGLTPASAAEGDAVNVVSEAVPAVVGDSTVGASSLDVAIRTGDVAIAVPSDADEGIEVLVPGSDDFSIGLPFADEATLTSTDAGVAFDNGNGSSTVPLVKDDGVVQLLTTIENANAPSTYSYPMDLAAGARLIRTVDGGAQILAADGTVTATIAAPWAVDANGDPVPTRYHVNGTTLTQVINIDTTTAFPVVADPTLSLGWWYYLHFNRAETKSVATMSTAAGTISTMCAIAGAGLGPLGAAALGTACAIQAFAIVYTANLAESSSPKKCLYLKWRPLSGGSVNPGTYKDSRCK